MLTLYPTRCPSAPRPPAQAKGCIKVLNNGAGIPVEVHAKEGIYVPELIFGNLLTSSNYNDNEKKVGGTVVGRGPRPSRGGSEGAVRGADAAHRHARCGALLRRSLQVAGSRQRPWLAAGIRPTAHSCRPLVR